MKTILCDLDGTLANIDHRLHYLRNKDFDNFWGSVSNDTPNMWCVQLLWAMRDSGHEIIFVSGRNEVCRAATREWLTRLEFPEEELYMRPIKDRSSDYDLKKKIFGQHLAGKDILFVLEDRTQVVEMWRSKGLTVLQCDKGDF